MLIDRNTIGGHSRWILVVLLATAAAVAWYSLHASGRSAWPGGSSPPGLAFGIGAGLIMIFEFLLWPRRYLRRLRLGRARTWMRAHIWLGLLTVPLIVLHSGFALGGLLSTAVTAVFAVVILSGVFGLYLQQVIPRKMLDSLPAETIHTQLETVSRMLAEEAAVVVDGLCGTVEEAPPEHVRVAARERAGRQVVGAIRRPSPILRDDLVAGAVPGAEGLRAEFEATIRPYLLRGRRSGSPLAAAGHAARMFETMREAAGAEAHAAVSALEGCCEQRRQFDRQRRLHWWLHAWLSVHLPLSAALMVLMILHAYFALLYMTPAQ